MIIKEINVKNILTKSNLPIAGYSINPYVGCTHACKYCYANFLKRFTNHKEEWGTFLDVKYWPKITNPHKYDGSTMIIGSVTDGYIPQESKYKRTRQFLEEVKGANIKLIITTKSDLVLRDLDLIKTFQNPLIAWSINTLDENFKMQMEKTTSIARRIEAMKICHNLNIRTTCFISPIFPGITNVFEIIEKIKEYVDYIWLENLNLRGDFKLRIMEYIKSNKSELLPLYESIYNKGDMNYWNKLDKEVKKYAFKNSLEYVIDEEPFLKKTNGKPIIINYFYHSDIKQSAKK